MTRQMLLPSHSQAPPRVYEYYGKPLWQRTLLTREFAVIAMLALVAIFATLTVRNFASPLTLSYLLLDTAAILLVALPMTLILVSGEIDLSVASAVGLSNVVLGALYAAGWPIQWAIAAALASGAVVGLVNGVLVAFVGLPSLAVTIGTLALFRGIAVGILGSASITDFPAHLKSLANQNIPGTAVPFVMIVVIILVVVFALLLHRTTFGRSLYFIGRSPKVAQFSGVKVARTKLILFIFSGVIAALAGVYFTFRYGSARGDNAEGLELTVIAAVLLGGVSIFGGRGAIHGVVAAVLLIGIIQSALRLANVTADVINIVIGALLIASVVVPSCLAWVRRRFQPAGRVGPPGRTTVSTGSRSVITQ